VLIKNHSNILKLQFQNFSSQILIFEVFEKKVRHKTHYVFENEAENMI